MTARSRRFCLLAIALLVLLPFTIWAKAPEPDYNKSWMWVDVSSGGKPLVSGDSWDVPVDYYVDPTEFGGKTTLAIWGAGPWIDTPDGKYIKERGHIPYPGLFTTFDIRQAGPGRHVFHFRVPPALDLVRKKNRILLIGTFRDAAGKTWPWEHRVNASFVRRDGKFEIEGAEPGNLFTYGEPVRLMLRLKNVDKPGDARTLHYVARDTTGALAAEGMAPFTAERDDQAVPLDLKLTRRGAFTVDVDVPGWESRRTTVARVPDIAAITRGRPTQFGMTVEGDSPPEETWAVARRLGFSTCRRFVPWYRVEPGPGVYKLDDLERELDAAKRHGIREWICIGDPPPFAFKGAAFSISYNAFDFREDVWRDFVRTVSTRLKGKFIGWEWLNEITPGRAEDPVGSYTRMVKIGNEVAKSIDPSLLSILAGGLWPRSFRNAVLAAGVGKDIDVLPVHYQNGGGVREAREDLDAVGRPGVAVWDDETARGRNAWAVPTIEEIENTEQAAWVLNQWPDELTAGCRKITYFGGRGDAAGSWDYALDDLTPRPITATLAVLSSKLAGAAPLGAFQDEYGGQFHLFERDGKTVLVASVDPSGGSAPAPLRVGSASVTISDYQGNETVVRASSGTVELPRARLPYFVEGADPDTIKALVVPEIAAANTGSGAGAGNIGSSSALPSVAVVRGGIGRIGVRLHNPYARELGGYVELTMPSEWQNLSRTVAFRLAPGQSRVEELAVRVPESAATSDYPVRVVATLALGTLRRVEKPMVLSVISPDMLGNLLPNGGFEQPNAAGTGPEGFAVNGKTVTWAPAEGLHEGLGQHVVKIANTTGWENINRTVPVRGGQTYLYTFWARNKDMDAGSNMTIHLANGRDIQLFDMAVIYCGPNNLYWQMFACRKQMPEGAKSCSFLPLANGKGWATFDNLRVTLYRGTDYVAEAHRTHAPPKLGGSLDTWTRTCPIPLIGRNQLTYQAPGYAWTPDNLSAIGYLNWDDRNLYVAVDVRDETHHPATTASPSGDAILQGDSVVLAIDPTVRGTAARSRAFEYCLSSASPGGGSGRHTLFRPPVHSGGRPAGHLSRDSSIYDLAVVPTSGGCMYQLRIPLSELGVQGAVGTRIGLSIQVNDNDGHGLAGQMNWGGGLYPSWNPMDFGMVTLVE
ncbi:MAG TPA: NEW3 domain-containing protein [Chthonomonadaceae bacterium]|nr:NEW3 domain-containing protein [Chthonomonadaceae bacterium]